MSEEKKSGMIQEGIMDKEIESFMGLDKERQENKQINITKDKTDERKFSALRMLLRRAFHFNGFSGLSEFLWAFSLGIILFIALSALNYFLLRQFVEGLNLIFGLLMLISPALVILHILLGFGLIALMMRRYKDIGVKRLLAIIPFILSPIPFFLSLEWSILVIVLILIFTPFILLGLKPSNLELSNRVKSWHPSEVKTTLYKK